MDKQFSQCCGFIAKKEDKDFICQHCKEVCKTRPYDLTTTNWELLTEIRDLLRDINGNLQR